MTSTECEALMVLNAIPGLTPRRIKRLIRYFGSAARILNSKRQELLEAGVVPQEIIERMLEFDRDYFVRDEWRLIRQHGAAVIAFDAPDYPFLLKEIPDAPVLLYVKGRYHQADNLSLAVVGSRRSSLYGLTMAREFAGQLAELGFTVVSGLARGIDTAAHQGCLAAQSRTLAVLGCGLSQIYPRENERLGDEIAAHGAILSEFPMTMPPKAQHFPQRNRIISGLTLGVLVIEAARRSGALITSRYALEQGREVFALPGRAKDPQSQGTNGLIQQGAKLVTGVADILEELQTQVKVVTDRVCGTREGKTERADVQAEFTPDERAVMGIITHHACTIEVLAAQIPKPLNQLMSVLLGLEMKNKVRKLPGMLFAPA